MLNVFIVGLEAEQLKQTIAEGYPEIQTVAREEAELIICYGGDGTLLYAEHHFPGVPKVLLRKTMLCAHCEEETRNTILNLLAQRKYEIKQLPKIQITSSQGTLTGIYDVVVGHAKLNTTVRMRLSVDGVEHAEEIVGDGIVVATPIGSTGYYQSITRSTFQRGLGIAFNNSVNTTSHMVVSDGAKIAIRVTRGPGVVAADNLEEVQNIDTDDVVTIHQAEQTLQLVTFPEPFARYNFTMNRLPSGTCQLCGKRYQ